ncbi:MAG: deoxyribonuclease IV [Magnetococcales bacterium]|nr:deoxyribonuclease IV [Magnetococcales bacterium]MBF0322246.1 deoxyribonuclease IV [Magnetococcales bacterium]
MAKRVGAHVSIAGGVWNAPLHAQAIGASAFAMFTKNQRQWQTKPLSAEDVRLFKENLAGCGFRPTDVLPHDGYLINLGHPEPQARAKSLAAFIDEMRRCSQLGLPYLNFHPGSHLKELAPEACLDLIADGINQALEETEGVVAVIENTAGQGSNLGHDFGQIAHIIERIKDQARVGVCLDTCHAFAAGYDLRTPETYAATMDAFGKTIGFSFLRGMHLNDAKKGLNSRVDRHENLGRGLLGTEPFRYIMQDSRMEEMPLILETIDETLWPKEIKLLQAWQ